MRAVLGFLGNLLMAVSLAGLMFLFAAPPDARLQFTEWVAAQTSLSIVAPRTPVDALLPIASPETVAVSPRVSESARGSASPTDVPAQTRSTSTVQPLPTATPAPRLPITRLEIPRVKIEADVVQAHLVEHGGAVTWEVPAHKAGHAEYTAGAGERGNAVLLGHVDSRNSGNVFKDLDDARVGDLVDVASGPSRFVYRVVEVRSVPRTDVSVVEQTETPTLTLITCTGAWLQAERDFSERLIVRAELDV